MSEPTWFLLYGGTSEDGAGPGVYVGRTTDPKVATNHNRNIKRDPYSTGYVLVVTDTQCRRAWSSESFSAGGGQ